MSIYVELNCLTLLTNIIILNFNYIIYPVIEPVSIYNKFCYGWI